jgi:hypothetical protein
MDERSWLRVPKLDLVEVPVEAAVHYLGSHDFDTHSSGDPFISTHLSRLGDDRRFNPAAN